MDQIFFYEQRRKIPNKLKDEERQQVKEIYQELKETASMLIDVSSTSSSDNEDVNIDISPRKSTKRCCNIL